MTRSTSRRTVLAAALAAAAGGVAAPALAASGPGARVTASVPGGVAERQVDNHFWSTAADWTSGTADGTRVVPGARPGVAIDTPAGSTDYTDPHTGRTDTWEYASWTSPAHALSVPATELIASWNADTPDGTWIQIELRGGYTDGTSTPWYVMGRWAGGDEDVRRTSLDDQADGKSAVWTDTLSVDDPDSGLRLATHEVRVTLYRKPGSEATPTVWRAGAMGSDVPDRFTVPASSPGLERELTVPRYSQNVHVGQYPEYDNGGEAWCSPTSSQMIVEYWGRKPTEEQLAWVNPDFADPQVCHAARFTYDYQYEGCGNWPFNAAYAATYQDMQAVVTRLGSLGDLETLIGAGIPVITSQSFLEEELTGAGYGTSGHLMTVIGFTADGDVVANDPASADNDAVRRVYNRREWENIWLRTQRHDADGEVASGTGGVCYLYFPVELTADQRDALASVGVL